ncbi:riboflavin synthase [Desulfovibrio subterraneus]|jgi:riboflavin synthase|uniref:Riboflavin synthase n=1 Tax=Desulfovibrio subterraneus TaxID=2718620 RepID=A0A7J0BJN0_9BACT|nr:riboflavin synthase [Desulfovibrio subterraneus]WBF67502.1 riboflavin synthase [Desulfovibrio subterraneus]GFM33335.1 riboflavin synthase subunit alpha [Desulfovibrio subterraneus]
MFTGLILGQGEIRSVQNMGSETRLTIRPLCQLTDIVLGESIATNGVCLTVETFGADWFTVYASAESMRLTNLGDLKSGSRVNLERALAMGDRLGGHIVSGHVDCVASVASVRPAGLSRVYRLSFPAEFGAQIITKGSVALDGISLTINDCGPDFLEVNIIPETQKVTTISEWKPGYRVNLETDVIGKYVQRMLGAWQGKPAAPKAASGVITEEFLRKHGF